jgi:hypothetical protein
VLSLHCTVEKASLNKQSYRHDHSQHCIMCCSVRRFSKTEDTSSSFSQKRCIAWFREYTSPDDPDVLGEFMHGSWSMFPVVWFIAFIHEPETHKLKITASVTGDFCRSSQSVHAIWSIMNWDRPRLVSFCHPFRFSVHFHTSHDDL